MSIARLLLTLAFAGVFAVLAAVGMAGLSGIGHRWADILAQFPGPAFAGAVGLIALCLVLRLPGAAWLGVAAAIVLAGAAWPQWFPPRTESAGGPVVRVYSANLWIGNTDVERVRRSVVAADADVVMLLEVGDAMAAGLDVVLADYPQRFVTPRRSSRNGPVRYVVASRAPMTVTKTDPSPEGAARVQTTIGPIQFIPVHLTRPWPFQIQWEQIRQTGRAAAFRHKLEGPVVLAGDFNSVSSARIGRMMQAEAGVKPAPGWPGTWPSGVPAPFRMTIDQVYATPELTITSRRLGRPTGSDHSPVITEIGRARAPSPAGPDARGGRPPENPR